VRGQSGAATIFLIAFSVLRFENTAATTMPGANIHYAR
jgi:hypothetical protein